MHKSSQEAAENPFFVLTMDSYAVHGTQPSNMKRRNISAGWRFLFNRCSSSTALQIDLTPPNAETILKALSGKAPSPDLTCVEDMRVTFPETDDTTENAAVLVAFSILAVACKNTQVCSMMSVTATAANVTAPAISLTRLLDFFRVHHTAPDRNDIDQRPHLRFKC